MRLAHPPQGGPGQREGARRPKRSIIEGPRILNEIHCCFRSCLMQSYMMMDEYCVTQIHRSTQQRHEVRQMSWSEWVSDAVEDQVVYVANDNVQW
ncbi:uncharacterized protein K489DRAFT_382442 [Dissoconium aciculare CBS 342.82]|uniref:Uncharacterized protein n=1 Tax=Dissoconium aciculare CBS 342.82 TaxID=1314786 RepID=A0A6J3LYZ1_9PEZI|nr:uncharacterized protein K489DRAFT_382442 [Dissoconium aciculare CBS 342.82]KAF1820504.1 hypothetical protein K489DRAFT_382442 [Dissoconium aciculare CBS 342.82]